jgi:hypothetical protein
VVNRQVVHYTIGLVGGAFAISLKTKSKKQAKLNGYKIAR